MEQATLSAAREVASDFFAVLTELDAGTLGAVARARLVVDEPLFGRWSDDGFAERFDLYQRWLRDRSAAFTRDELTIEGSRAVREWTLYLAEDGRDIVLPVAVVADAVGDEMRIRVYHSTWPLTGRHEVRPPIVSCEGVGELPDVVGEYHRALAAGDLEAILGLFAEDGCAREPAGGEWTYCGPQRLREFYGALFSAGGGIHLRHCTRTDDGTRFALEYVADRWGTEAMAPQAGLAVYERDSRGKLAAARIYDDVTPPKEADLSL